MVSDLGVPLEHLERATSIVSGFLLGYVAGIPLVAPLSDARGRGAVYVGALALFAAGSVLTASAPDLNRLVVGRAVQGFAGGALVPVSLALVADLFPAAGARLLALGIVAAAQEVGSLAGPIYGAAVSQWAADLGGWRAVFWLNLPLAAVCAVLFAFALRRSRPRLPRIDAAAPAGARWSAPVGAVSLAAGMTLLVLGLYPTDATRSPVNEHALPLLAGAAVALAVFGFTRRGRPAAWGALAVNLLVGAALVAALAELPVLAGTLFGLDQTGSALLLSRFLLGIPVGAVLGGWLGGLDRRLPAAGGMLISALCFWRMSAWTGLDAGATPVLFACGLGFGLVIAPVLSAVLDAAVAEEHGAASASAVLARTAGMVAGIALLTAYGFHRFYGELARCPRSGGGGLLPLPGAAFLACATGAARDQYHDVFLLAAVLCVIAAAVSLGLSSTRHARPAL